jgi:hypothetical protein
MIKGLHNLGENNITYWHKDMLYPFKHKFILYDDIKDSLTGFMRVIEFRCFKADHDGLPDPSQEGSEKHNWILNMSEG